MKEWILRGLNVEMYGDQNGPALSVNIWEFNRGTKWCKRRLVGISVNDSLRSNYGPPSTSYGGSFQNNGDNWINCFLGVLCNATEHGSS